jgi:hypothetical protein
MIIIPKKDGSFGDTLDYEITEMNTETKVKVSQGKLIDAIAKGNTNVIVAEILFGHPQNFIVSNTISKFENFIFANPNYFHPIIRQHNVPPQKIVLIAAMDIWVHFAELLRNIYKDMLVQNSKKKDKTSSLNGGWSLFMFVSAI